MMNAEIEELFVEIVNCFLCRCGPGVFVNRAYRPEIGCDWADVFGMDQRNHVMVKKQWNELKVSHVFTKHTFHLATTTSRLLGCLEVERR